MLLELALSLATAQYSPPPLVDAPSTVAAPTSPPPLVNSDTAAPAFETPEFSTNSGVANQVAVTADPVEPPAPHVPMLGVGLDVGAPDGAGVSAYVRLFRFLELHGGVAHNGVTPGLRGGVTFLPWDRWFVPTLTLEVGEHPNGDANPALRFFTGNDALSVSQLQDVGYSYQSALAGFEFGSREHYMIFFRAGVTRVVGHAGSNEVVASNTSSAGNATGASFGNIDAELTLPAAKLGFALFFF